MNFNKIDPKIKLICLDFYNTLWNTTKKEINPEFFDLIYNQINKGNYIAITTSAYHTDNMKQVLKDNFPKYHKIIIIYGKSRPEKTKIHQIKDVINHIKKKDNIKIKLNEVLLIDDYEWNIKDINNRGVNVLLYEGFNTIQKSKRANIFFYLLLLFFFI